MYTKVEKMYNLFLNRRQKGKERAGRVGFEAACKNKTCNKKTTTTNYTSWRSIYICWGWRGKGNGYYQNVSFKINAAQRGT